MGVSRKSHGKKSDKETQSPVLKIFRDIMQKENKDPEKVNLLKDKKKEKRRKLHPETRPKPDQRSYDSSSTDRYKANEQTNITVQDAQEDKNGAYYHDRTRSDINAFRGDKRESWWFWGDNQNQKKQKGTDDTCSCVSCALKKIVGSEYTCVACLFILFSVSVAIIFLTVFKTMTVTDIEQVKSGDDEGLVKRAMMKEKRQLTEGYAWSDYTERNKWDDSSDLGRFSGYNGESREGLNPPDVQESLSGDLANVLDAEKIMEGQNSRHLREFFKRLLQTDAQIRKLKQALDNNYLTDIKTINDRFKRSIRNKHKHSHKKPKDPKNTKIEHESKARVNKTEKESPKTNDRNVTGFLIKEEKIIINFEPERSNFPKCLHPHEIKHHETKLKHPFYKNSQRIDEMLGTYKTPDKKFDDGIDKLLFVEKDKKENPKSKDKSEDISVKERELADMNYFGDNIEEMFTNQQTNATEILSNDIDNDLEVILATTPIFGEASSTSTYTNAEDRGKQKHRHANKHPGHRRLLQVDDEEDKEDLVYEDLREVLTDEGQSHDELDRPVDRNKRDDKYESDISSNSGKYSPQSSHKFNWKGSMPLYPDELNAMIKQAALQNLNIVPINTKDVKHEKDKTEKDISDTEYIEDYVDNKYNKMVKMAQAYSDYGVLYGKKDKPENLGEKENNNQDNKLKFSLNKESLLNRFFGRPKKGSSCGEGITIQTKKGEAPNEKDEFMKSIQKHIKIVKSPQHDKKCKTLHPINPHEIFTPTHTHITPDNEIKHTDTHVIFTLRKGSRSLKSIEMDGKANIVGTKKITFYDKNNDASDKNTHETRGLTDSLSLMSNWLKKLSYRSGSGQFDGLKIKNLPKDEKLISRNNNVGRRSRVLMTVDDASSVNDVIKNEDVDKTSIGVKKRKNYSELQESDNTVPIALVLATNDIKDNTTDEHKSKEIEDKNRTIVKRNVESEKSVFWNDIYDDNEYGVKIDYLDNIRNKHSAKNVMEKSKDWFRGRFNNLTRKIKGRFKMKSTTAAKKMSVNTCDSCKTKPRPARQVDSNQESDIKKNFAKLTANMRKVCREAVKAVRDTKNIEVREESKEDGAATSLMQHLIRLMTDLVDIQVQQKSCAKLPSDLHNFLEWLTIPEDDNAEVDDLASAPAYTFEDGLDRYEKSTYPSYDLTLTEDTHQDDRTECLGTIRAVQDLIQQYEGMSDEDKSKMTGVKDYLENQLEFLNRKLSGIDETNLYKLYEKRETPRSRRDLFIKSHHNNDKQGKDGTINRFIKTFAKKRTKSTANTYDGVTVTKAKKHSNKTLGMNEIYKDNKPRKDIDKINKSEIKDGGKIDGKDRF